MKTYKLLKDLPNFKAGTKFEERGAGFQEIVNHYFLPPMNDAKFSDWFEEVKEDEHDQTLTIGNRTYELVVFQKEGESSVSGDTMIKRAKELKAELGEEDGCFILEHQNEIPVSLRGKVCMVFPKWRDPDDEQSVTYLGWCGGAWCQHWYWLDDQWDVSDRLLKKTIKKKNI